MSRIICLIISFLWFIHSAHGVSCQDIDLKWYDAGKTKVKKQKLCKEGSYKIYSENCLENKCQPFKTSIKAIPSRQIYRNFGTPAANTCKFIGGEPTLYEMKQDSDWHEIDFCHFKSDNSLISSSYVYEIHKGFIK